MATSLAAVSSLPIQRFQVSCAKPQTMRSSPLLRLHSRPARPAEGRCSRLVVRAVDKAPKDVIPPKEEPKLEDSSFGFTQSAEILNSRVAMIGIVGIVLVEAITDKGILEMLGLTVGKGINLPL